MLVAVVVAVMGVVGALAGLFSWRASAAEDRAREEQEMEEHLVTEEFLSKQRALARASQAERDRAIVARVKDPDAPTRAEVDAAMDREEREP